MMNIFIARLSPQTTSEDLEQIFSEFGEIKSARVVMDRDTGHSKRYGFVEMTDDESAQAAIDALNDTDLDGHTIVVKKSEPRGDSRGGGGHRGGGGGGRGRSNYNRGEGRSRY